MPTAKQIVAILILGWATPAFAGKPAFADKIVHAGMFVGANHLGANVELGNAAFADQVPGSSFLAGFRASLRLFGGFRLELEGKYAPARTLGSDLAGRPGVAGKVLGVRAQVTYDLFDLGPVSPFALVGGGIETLLIDAPSDYRVASADTDEVAHWGLGARIDLSRGTGLRFEARQAVTAGRTSRTTFTYEAQAGFFFTFGGRSRLPLVAKQPAKKPERNPPVVLASVESVTEPNDSAGDEVGETEQRLEEQPESVADADPIAEQDADAAARQQLENDTLEQLRVAIRTVRFKKGSARIRHRSRRRLRQAAQLLQDQGWVEIDVVGHTDSSGNDRTNRALSRKRADYVKWYLVDHGIEASRIRTSGLGDAAPRSKSRAKNRRVEIAVD